MPSLSEERYGTIGASVAHTGDREMRGVGLPSAEVLDVGERGRMRLLFQACEVGE